jgi:hypothetical protein
MEFEPGIRDVSGVVFWGQLEQCVHSLGLPFKQEIPPPVVFENKRLRGRFSRVFEE